MVARGAVALALLSLCGAASVFDRVLQDVTPCEDSCAKSYSPHTNPDSKGNDACERGCRFYTISAFISEGGSENNNVQPVKTTCYNSCVEAYNETSDSTVACKFGCDAQEQSTDQDTLKDGDGKSSVHVLRPLMQLQAIYSSVVGAIHVVRTSLVTYFISDDNTIVAVESDPEIMMEVVPEEQPRMGLEGQPRTLGMGQPSVVSCVSQRLGVPPYLLVASAMVLVLFTIYVIFAVCTTAAPPKQKQFSGGLSVQADPLPLPIKLVRPEDLTKLSLMEEEDQQAPPLPSKVKLPDTHI